MKPPGAASRAKVPLCLARNRVDSPTPILVAIASSLVRSTGPGMPSSSGMVMPRPRIRPTQVAEHVGVEGQVADDVRGVAALVPHRLDGEVVADRRVRLGVAGDADVRERAARARLRSSSSDERVRVAAGRVGVAGRDEDRGRCPCRSAGRRSPRARRGRGPSARRGAGTAVYPCPVSRSARSRVASSPLLGEAVTVTATSRADVLEHGVLDRGGGQHLVARVLAAAAPWWPWRACGLVAHCAPCFVMRTERRQPSPAPTVPSRASAPVSSSLERRRRGWSARTRRRPPPAAPRRSSIAIR